MELEKVSEQLAKDTESLKLFKNSRGYNWEIKILSTDVKRLEELNEQMLNTFSNGE